MRKSLQIEKSARTAFFSLPVSTRTTDTQPFTASVDRLCRQSLSTEAVNGCVSVVLVETGKLKNAVRADFSICSYFLMQSALQNRPAVAHKQCREGVQLVKSRGQHGPGLRFGGFELLRAGGHRSKNQLGRPTLGYAVTELSAGTHGRCRGSQSHQNIFAAVVQEETIPQRQGAALIQTCAAEARTIRPDLGFAKHERRVRPRTESSRRQPHRGNAATGRIFVITHLPGEKQAACASKLLII